MCFSVCVRDFVKKINHHVHHEDITFIDIASVFLSHQRNGNNGQSRSISAQSKKDRVHSLARLGWSRIRATHKKHFPEMLSMRRPVLSAISRVRLGRSRRAALLNCVLPSKNRKRVSNRQASRPIPRAARLQEVSVQDRNGPKAVCTGGRALGTLRRAK